MGRALRGGGGADDRVPEVAPPAASAGGRVGVPRPETAERHVGPPPPPFLQRLADVGRTRGR